MIRLAARCLDRSTVLYLRLLRLINGRREHIQCRPPGYKLGVLRPESGASLRQHLRETLQAAPLPQVSLESRKATSSHNELTFRFPSPFPCGIPNNDQVHGYAWLHGEVGQAPAVVLVHGWMMSHFRGLHPLAEAFFERGLDVYFFELPYHMHRKPPGAFSGECYYGAEGQFTADSVRQSLLDVGVFLRWLRASGAPKVGVWGVSLGGWIALLTACYCEDVDLVVATVPACCLERLSRESLLSKKLMPKWRAASPAEAAEQLHAFDPVYLEPVVPAEKIVVVVANHDEIVPARFPLTLAEKWKRISVLRYPHGHISINMSAKMRREVAALAGQALSPEGTHAELHHKGVD